MTKSRLQVAEKSWFILFLLVTLAVGGCAVKSNTVTLADGRQAFKVRGKVGFVEPNIGVLVLEGRKGDSNISFTDKVGKRGFSSMADIRRGQPLEVIYLQDNLGNYAVSIKRLPDGSCDT